MKPPGKSALFTDLYQITMAYGYWRSGRMDDEAVFHLFFRNAPFGNGFVLAAGLEQVVDYLSDLQFEEEEIAFLSTLTGSDEEPLFCAGFLEYLRELRFTGSVDAVPEGTAIFANEPMLRITAPLIEAQLIETALLNLINFPTLIATKAARIVAAAGYDPVLEFGLRRAQGVDGAMTASRASYIGGCAATSNVLAGKIYGIPVKGTHAHSWVMSFDSEPAAFDAYANAMPGNCVFLVDTFDTIEGVKNAIAVGKRMRANGQEMIGIRLDSGDLAELSIEARRILDESGFQDVAIVASNDLDEYAIAALKKKGAKIGVWGVGTKLVTAYDQPALGGVYKLGAIRSNPNEEWGYRMKFSDTPAKASIPGIQQIRRTQTKDIIFCAELNEPGDPGEDLLKPVFRDGEFVGEKPDLSAIQEYAKSQWREFISVNSNEAVEIEPSLKGMRDRMIQGSNIT